MIAIPHMENYTQSIRRNKQMKYREHYINKSASALPKYNRQHSTYISLRNSNMSLYGRHNTTTLCKDLVENTIHLTETDISYFDNLLGIQPSSRNND